MTAGTKQSNNTRFISPTEGDSESLLFTPSLADQVEYYSFLKPLIILHCGMFKLISFKITYMSETLYLWLRHYNYFVFCVTSHSL